MDFLELVNGIWAHRIIPVKLINEFTWNEIYKLTFNVANNQWVDMINQIRKLHVGYVVWIRINLNSHLKLNIEISHFLIKIYKIYSEI